MKELVNREMNVTKNNSLPSTDELGAFSISF